MKRFKIYNPFIDKESVYQSPYKRTPLRIMKNMILELNYPKSILPYGVKLKNGRLYLKGKRGKPRADKIKKLERRNDFRNLTRKVERKLEAAQKVKLKRVENLKKKLKMRGVSFVPQERLRDKFNIVEIYLKLKRPTADHEKALALLKKYLKKRVAALRGHEIFMKLDFQHVHLEYFTGNIKVKNLDETYDHLSDSIDSWSLDQQEYESKERYKLAGMRIFVMVHKGGDYTQFPHLKGFVVKDLKPKIYCPRVTSHNCLLDCCDAFKNRKKKMKNARVKIICESNAEYDKVREAIGLPQGTKIGLGADMEEVLSHYRLNANIYEVSGNYFAPMLQYELFDDAQTMNLWLYEGHYNLVLNPSLLEYAKCGNCGKWHANRGKNHECDKHFCQKCGLYVSQSHPDDLCKGMKRKRQRRDYVMPAEKHKEYTADKNIIFADFETFNDRLDASNGVHRVYACAYCIDNGPVSIFEGVDALDKFMESLLALDKSEKFTMVFYNGSRFDCFFIYDWLQKNKIDTNILYHNGAYKKIVFNKNIQTFDLCLFTNASLRKACKDFGCAIQKGDFDHARVNSYADAVATRDDWLQYLKLDILSMKPVFS